MLELTNFAREKVPVAQPLLKTVDAYFAQMARSWVDLGPLFSYGAKNAVAIMI